MIISFLLFTLATAFDFRAVVKDRNKKEILFYSLCMAAGFAMIILNDLGAPPFGPDWLITQAAKVLSLIP